METSTAISSSSKIKPTTTTANTTQKPSIKNTNWKQQNGSNTNKQRPPLVLGYPPQRGTLQIDDSKEVQVKSAFR